MRNPLDLVRGIFTKPPTVPAQTIKDFPQIAGQIKQDPKAFSSKDTRRAGDFVPGHSPAAHR